MKKKILIYNTLSLLIISLISVQTGCNNNNDPAPVEKKKYAWVTGSQDTTGYGMILFSPDAGETWERQGFGDPSFNGVDFKDIWAIDEHTVWATGSNNTLIKTTGGRANWEKIELPENTPGNDLGSISIYDKKNIWIVGGNASFSTVYSSEDAGASWKLHDSSFFKKINLQGICALSPEKVYVTGSITSRNQERLFVGYTLNGGNTWDSVPTANLYNEWFGIGIVSSQNTVIVYGGIANYMVSFDQGNTWQHDSIPNTGGGGPGGADINDLIMLDSQTWWGALDLGNIYITHDGGTSWTKQQTPEGPTQNSFLVGIDSWDDQLALVAGYAFFYPPESPILKTSDGGKTWESKYTTTSELWKVSFIK